MWWGGGGGVEQIHEHCFLSWNLQEFKKTDILMFLLKESFFQRKFAKKTCFHNIEINFLREAHTQNVKVLGQHIGEIKMGGGGGVLFLMCESKINPH